MKGSLCRCTGYRAIEDAIRGISHIEDAPAGSACGRSVRGARRSAKWSRAPRGTRSTWLHAGAPSSEAPALAARACTHHIDPQRAPRFPCRASTRSSPGRTRRQSSIRAPGMRTTASTPDDTAVLDNVVRFVGQRVAAVVGRERRRRRGRLPQALKVDYELLPAVFDPEEAMRPGAPIIHDKGPQVRIDNPQRNIVAEVHGHVGDVEKGFAEADVVHEATYLTPRSQHAHLETHCAIAWLDETGRLNVRSSTQTPFLTRRALSADIRSRSRQSPRVLRAHGRRLRRQAGNAGRGHRGAGGAQDRKSPSSSSSRAKNNSSAPRRVIPCGCASRPERGATAP